LTESIFAKETKFRKSFQVAAAAAGSSSKEEIIKAIQVVFSSLNNSLKQYKVQFISMIQIEVN
jgi:hypothetical protein